MSIRSAANAAKTAPGRLWAAVVVLMFAPPLTDDQADPSRHREGPASDRGDVPGWVMITVMTAIVVLALIIVFKDAVLSAVGNAFDKIVNYKD